MPAPFPHRYEVALELDDPAHAEGTLAAAEALAFRVGPPPQFDGRPGHHSPEDLLLSAIASCHMTTLVALARRKELPIRSYAARASGTLEKTRDGIRFTTLRLRVDAATDAGREAELKALIETAETHCIVSRALALRVELEVVTPDGKPGLL
jgi:organic hydroperoxide reductase OsmC/OhrA